MTNREIISQLRNSIKEVSSDSMFTNRYLYNTALTVALMYLERDKKSLSNSDLYVTKSFETESVNLNESSCYPYDCWGCRVKLPVLSTKTGPLYRFISSPDFSKEWKIVNPVSFQRKSKMKSKYSYAYKDGDYIYFTDCPPCLNISYIPSSLKDDSGETCSRLEDQFIIPDYLLTYVIQDSLQVLGYSKSAPQDHVQNKNTLS